MKTKKNLIFADECYQIMGVAFKVYKELGFGHKENVYQKALAEEFESNGFDFAEQLRYKLIYKKEILAIYILDFLVFGKIILEIKQKSFISSKDIDQIYKYLRAKKLKLGIIITFANDGVRFKRIVNLR